MFQNQLVEIVVDVITKRVLHLIANPQQLLNKPNFKLLNANHQNIHDQYIHKLPKNFAIDKQYALELLAYQMELECAEQISDQVRTHLMELYWNGMQYYKQRNDQRQDFFRKKIQFLQYNALTSEQLIEQQQMKNNTSRKKKQFQKMVQVKFEDLDDKLQAIMKNVEQMQETAKIAEDKIQETLNAQLSTIKKRIQHRSKKHKDNKNIIQNQEISISKPLSATKRMKVTPQFQKNSQQSKVHHKRENLLINDENSDP